MHGSLGLAFGLSDEEVFVDVRDDTSAGDGGLDEEVEFFVSPDGQLKVSRGDSSHFEVLGCVSRQFEHLGCEVFQDGSSVDCSCRAHSVPCGHSALEETVDSADWELKSSSCGFGLGGSFGLAHLASLASFSALASLACH